MSEENNESREVEKENEKEVVTEEEVEKNSKEEKNEDTSEDEVRGCTLDQFIDKKSPFRRTKIQILNQILSYHITLNHLTRF